VRQQRRSSQPRGDVSGQSRLAIALLALVLAGAAWAAYSTSFRGVFVLDDKFAVLDNPNIRKLWPLTESMSAPPENPVSGRPVASLTLALNYALAPDDVRNAMFPGGAGAPPGTHERFLRNIWGYHLLNLLLHILAGLALFGVVRRTLLSDPLQARFDAASTPLAFAAALIWLVHPLTTDAVTYITQRTEVLMGLWYLLTLYCAIRAGERGVSARRQAWWMAAAIAACALGMGSKQTMLSAPVMVWLWDWMFGSRATRDTSTPAGRRWPLYAGLAATWILLAALIAHERWPTSVGLNLRGWTPWTYLLTQTGVIAHYLRLSVVPWPLALDYDGWPMARSVLDVAPSAALLTVLFCVTVIGIVRRQPWAYAAAWCFALLAPSSSLLPLPTEVAAERRMYLPLAGLAALTVTSVFLAGRALLVRAIADARARRRVGTLAGLAVVAIVAVTYGTMTHARNRDYWSDEGIWADTVAKRPDNPRARLNYGVDLSMARRYADAEQQLREAVRLNDASAPAHGNLGAVLCAVGRLDEGIPHLERALALDPAYTDAYPNLGEAYGAQGKRAQAAKYFALAVDVSPDNPFLLNRLGWLLATSPEDGVRNGARAVEVGERAVRLTFRQDVTSLDTLAAAYAEAGRFADAVAAGREAVTLAVQQSNDAIVPELRGRLALYEAGQRFRERG
jgi:tetratricopeptide (TPR) repeat protein